MHWQLTKKQEFRLRGFKHLSSDANEIINKLVHVRAFTWERALLVGAEEIGTLQGLHLLQMLNLVDSDLA